MIRFLRLTFLCLILFPGMSLAQSDTERKQPTLDEIFKYKETFRYEVKYGFFKLGWVEVEMLPDTLYKGKMHKHMVTRMLSNPKIPFVGDEADYFHSLFYVNEEGLPESSLFWKDNLDENKPKEIIYEFDRDSMLVRYDEKDGTTGTMELTDPATAGNVVFYFTRLFAGSGRPASMRVYVNEKMGYLNFESPTKPEKREYAAFDEPVESYLMNGTTHNIEGPFGFSGEFRSWFLRDEIRVPLEARVKVFWGNVIVRIIEYKREKL